MKFRKVVMILSIFLLGITTSCKKRSENNNNNDNKNPQQEDENKDVNSNQTVKFKVIFIVDEEEDSYQNVIENDKCSIPKSPSKEGYTFSGWY